MAGDEIFIGSVSVGVVPDLRGFNDKVRAELVPAANRIGEEIGREITRGIMDKLDLGSVIAKATVKARTAATAAGAELGERYGKAFRKAFELSTKDPVIMRVKVDDKSLELMRRKISLSLRDAFTIKVRADVDRASLARAAVAFKLATGAVSGGGGATIDDLIKLIAAGGRGARGGGRRGGGGGFFGGLLGLGEILTPGGGGGAAGLSRLAGAGPAAGIGVAALIAAAAPFIGQALGGLLVGGLGTGLLGLGIGGALMGNVSGQAAQTAARDRYAAAQLRVAAAQERLNKLETGGKATTAQLLSAHAALASALAARATAQDKYNDINQRSQKNVAALQTAFNKLEPAVKDALSKIGAPFIPVLTQIFNQAAGVIKTMTPIFVDASKIIAGPFKLLADTVLKAFTDPAVKSSIIAVATAFASILTAFTPDIPGIMDSLAQAITRMSDAIAKNPKAFADFLNFLFQIPIVLVNFVAVLTDAANWIEAHWTNAWKRIGINTKAAWHIIAQSVVNVLHFIRDIFKLFIDLFSGNWKAVWKDILNIGKDFSDQLKILFLELMPLLWGIIRKWLDRIKSLWDFLWHYLLWAAVRSWHAIVRLFEIMGHEIAHDFDTIRHYVAHVWDMIWNNTIGRLMRGVADSQRIVAGLEHNIAHWFDNLRHAVAAIWDAIWNWIVSRATQGAHDLMSLFTRLKTNIVNWFHDAVNWLVNAGKNIITGLYNGIKAAIADVGNWVNNNVVQPIVHWIEHHFGIKSPSTVMFGIGKNLVAGLMHGLFTSGKDLTHFIVNVFGGLPQALGGMIQKGLIDIAKLPEKALHALGGVAGKLGGFFAKLFGGGGGSGVQRWAGLVAQALTMLGLPLSLGKQVLYQMQTESGGNPNAINLTDINAQRGDPSRGLLQVIGSTFAAYHVPGTSGNIYDPLANIAAAINYAMHVYGPSLMRGGMGMGSGHGYAAGTGGAAPGWAWVGERGPELVNFVGGETVVPYTGRGYQGGTDPITPVSAVIAESQRIGAANAAAAAAAKAHTAAVKAHDKSVRALEAAIRAHARAIAKMESAGASMAASAAKITTATTASSFAATQRLFLKDLTYYFTPSVANQRSNMVIRQIAQLESLETQIKKLDANIKEANSFQQQTLAHLQSGAGLGAIGIQGQGAAQGRSLLAGLNLQVSVIRGFGNAIAALSRAGAPSSLLRQVAGMDPSLGTTYARTMVTVLKKLKALKAPASIVNQLIALGPDAALAYANALQAAGPKTLAQIIAAETALGSAQLGVSRGITAVVEGGKYVTGPNFIAGLKSQQAELNKVFAKAGRALAEEAIRWFNVPARQRPHGYQHGGWLNEPVYGYGAYSGAAYMFAEKGREYVLPESHMDKRGDGNTYVAHFDSLTGEAIESHVRTAFQAMSITSGALSRQGRRSLWECR